MSEKANKSHAEKKTAQDNKTSVSYRQYTANHSTCVSRTDSAMTNNVRTFAQTQMCPARQTLGILGGLGPMASAYFYELLTAHTLVQCDQEHIDLVLSSHAQTPDRTAFITGRSKDNPLPTMLQDIQKLEQWGVDMIAIPCNTAHYFYDALQSHSTVPILNIMEENARYLYEKKVTAIGILATDGTVYTRSYDRYMAQYHLTPIYPDEPYQSQLMTLIYDNIKKGRRISPDAFLPIEHHMRARGCERVILGCTELSLLKKELHVSDYFIDSMEVLAQSIILAFRKHPIGFTL